MSDDVKLMIDKEIYAFLVGEVFMRAESLGKILAGSFKGIFKICFFFIRF
jgi:indole-3-glycerol phosphate synthase